MPNRFVDVIKLLQPVSFRVYYFWMTHFVILLAAVFDLSSLLCLLLILIIRTRTLYPLHVIDTSNMDYPVLLLLLTLLFIRSAFGDAES